MSAINGTTNDTLTKLYDWETAYISGDKAIRIANTDAANSLNYEVHTILYLNGQDIISESGTITFGNFSSIIFNRDMADISVWLKSTVAVSPANFTVENYLTNKDIGFLQVFNDPAINLQKIVNSPIWTVKADMNTAMSVSSAFGASSTDGTTAGGETISGDSKLCESYNGITWNDIALLTNTTGTGGSGFGSSSTDGTIINISTYNSETYNGVSWINSHSLNTSGLGNSAFGSSSNDGLTASGNYGGALSNSETYNGVSWINSPNILVATEQSSAFGASSTDGLILGGAESLTTLAIMTTELYDGLSWFFGPNMIVGRYLATGFGGSGTDGLATGGASATGTYLYATEVFNGVAWSNADNIIARESLSSFGSSSTNGTAVGGNDSGYLSTTETYAIPKPSYPSIYWKES